jgi:hypothetical protein
MLISYPQAERPARLLYSLPPNFESCVVAKLEKYRERMKSTLEEMEMEIQALILSDKVMRSIIKVEELERQAPLMTYPPQKNEFLAEIEAAKKEKDASIKEEQECKSTVATLINQIGELDVMINGLQEMVEQYDE